MLVFCWLWGHCDKKGRFEWKPRILKLDILPFLDFNMETTLGLLVSAGLVRRYEVDGRQYAEIPSFTKHQQIGGKEAQQPAKYPEPTWEVTEKCPEPVRNDQGSSKEEPGTDPELQEGKGRERKGKNKPAASRLRSLPDGFVISDRVKAWATEKGFVNLDAHFEQFISYVKKKQPRYADWDEALMGCIRDDWGGVRQRSSVPQAPKVDL
jgi:hypothetical protein